MAAGGAAKKTAEAYRGAHQRFLHEINIPDEAGEQSATGEEHSDAVRPERVSVRESASGEGSPQPHQHAGNNAGDDALSRDFFALAHPTISLAAENYSVSGAQSPRR